MPLLSVVVTVYNQPLMLAEHCRLWRSYPDAFKKIAELVVIDDCSRISPAREEMQELLALGVDCRQFRILSDIEWNYLGARNLGAHVARGDWMLRLDADHVLPSATAWALPTCLPLMDPIHWYTFPRYRRGMWDDTRKDKLPRDAAYGEIVPHSDTFLCTRSLFWAAGGYDEDYCGSLGGSVQLRNRLHMDFGDPVLLPPDVFLECHTRQSIPDANVTGLSRDDTRRRTIDKRKAAAGWPHAVNPLRFEWVQVL